MSKAGTNYESHPILLKRVKYVYRNTRLSKEKLPKFLIFLSSSDERSMRNDGKITFYILRHKKRSKGDNGEWLDTLLDIPFIAATSEAGRTIIHGLGQSGKVSVQGKPTFKFGVLASLMA